ncbi:MAG: hypothetical protein WB660_00270 [Candidatus Sulfotelmatobacter sp.]
MHRPFFIAVFVLLAASVQLSAQRGGGHASAGGHGFSGGHSGFAGGHSGFASHGAVAGSGHNFAGMHSGFAPRSFSQRSFSRAPAFRGPLASRGFNRGRSGVGLRIRTRGFRNNCFGFGCWWGYYPYLGGGIDPYWWWDSDSPSDQYQQDPAYSATQMNAQGGDDPSGAEQGDPDVYARSAPQRPPSPERTQAAQATPATVLVFRDQRKEEVQNYAIVGQTLWVFAPQRTQKIPLAELDLDATQKVNDERGVDFRLPGAHEAQ